MREILFKAKYVDTGEWVEGSLVHYKAGEKHFIITDNDFQWGMYGSYSYDGDFTEIDETTICQYTGLTDKNGNKIWKNDIVKGLFYHGLEVKAVVGFKYGAFGLKWNRGDVEEFSPFTSICNCEYEIIGNIFDNPELLEGGAK